MLRHLHFIDFLESILPISEEAKLFLKEKVTVKNFKKGQEIITEGNVMPCFFFIRRGMIRSYLNYDGDEISTWVNWDGEIATSVSSFFNQSPSKKSIDSIEDTVVEKMVYDDFQEMLKLFPEIQLAYRIILENFLAQFEMRVFMSRIPNSRDRYEYFTKHYSKEYIDRIPKKIFASMLAVRPETLSRIIAEKEAIKPLDLSQDF